MKYRITYLYVCKGVTIAEVNKKKLNTKMNDLIENSFQHLSPLLDQVTEKSSLKTEIWVVFAHFPISSPFHNN